MAPSAVFGGHYSFRRAAGQGRNASISLYSGALEMIYPEANRALGRETAMSVSTQLKKLIEAAAPYWAGEAEVFATYWSWDKRNRASDRKWLAYQCSKEVWGSGLAPLDKGIFLGPAEELIEAFPKIDNGIDRHKVLEIAEGLWAEFAHYCAFADAHDALGEKGEPKLTPLAVKFSWKEDLELSRLRLKHRGEHPRLGQRATNFTEGGYCTLFSEGMKLKHHTSGPHGRANALIAAACEKVYDDEFGHMLKGIVGLDRETMTPADWKLLEELSIAQLRLRIVMRNSQFGYPLSEKRLAELLAGKGRPLAFDYDRARLAA
jgi:hypothetical protein